MGLFFLMIRWAKMMFKRVVMWGFLTFADIMNSIKQQNILQILQETEKNAIRFGMKIYSEFTHSS